MSSLTHLFRPAFVAIAGALAFAVMAGPAAAQVVSNERDIPPLRLGQKVQVDDGSCPAGQIKEVMGAALTESGVARTSKCVARLQRR